jgi:hypothetical protein
MLGRAWRAFGRPPRRSPGPDRGAAPVRSGSPAEPVEAVEDEVEAPPELCGGVVSGRGQPRRDLGEVRVIVERADLRPPLHGVAGVGRRLEPERLVTTGEALVALNDWTFLFGPGLAIGVNTTLLASLMYCSQLVARAIARVGLVGGPLVFASSVAILFGLYEQVSAVAAVAAFPVFAWEMSLAAWMTAKGFRPSPALERATPPRDLGSHVAPGPGVLSRGARRGTDGYEAAAALASVACSSRAASSPVAASSRGRSGARTGPVVSPARRQAALTAAG